MNQSVQQLQWAGEQEENIDLAKYLGFLSANRWLIAGVALIVTLLGLAYAIFAKPVYEADILVQVEDTSQAAPGNGSDELSSFFNLKTGSASEMEVLRSRRVVAKAVDNTHLYIQVSPRYLPLIGGWMVQHDLQPPLSDQLSRLGYVLGRTHVVVPVFNVPSGMEEDTEFTLTDEGKGKYRLTQEDTGIDLQGQVGRMLRAHTAHGDIELLVDALAAKPGAQFTMIRHNRLETIAKLQDALKIAEKGKQSDVIGVTLRGNSAVTTTNVLNEIAGQYLQQNEDRRAAEAERSLVFLNKQLPELKQQVETAEARYNELRNRRGTVDIGEEAKTALQQSVLAQTRLLELKQKKEELQARFTDDHPAIVAIDQQMRTLNKELDNVGAKIRKLPAVEQDVVRLTRDVKVNQDIYTTLLSTALQLRLVAESKGGNVRVLDSAVVPVKPAWPRLPLIVVLSAMAGLLLGTAAAYVRKNIYRRIDAPDEIEESLGLHVSATIPHSGNREFIYGRLRHRPSPRLALEHDGPSENVIESLRRLRASLQLSLADAKSNVVVITGPTPGVGKSFVSANFATVLAAADKRVLLVDGDLRTGHLHRYFGIDRGYGLSDVMLGKVPLDQAVRKNVAHDVDFISTGTLVARPAELLAHKNFEKLLKLFSSRYDVVLIDTPPLLAVSDAQIIAPHAGAVFNVVRGSVSTISEIEEAVKRLNEAGVTVTGTIYNDWNPRTARYRYGMKSYEKYLVA